MKRILALFALVGATLLGSSSAHAVTPLQTVTNGGVTCNQYSTFYAWPSTYWDCMNPTGSPGADEAQIVQSAASFVTNSNHNSTMRNFFTTGANNVELYAFADSADYDAFFGLGSGATSPTALGAARVYTVGMTTKRVAATFSSATQNTTAANVTVDLTDAYQALILQQMGRLWDRFQSTPFSSTLEFQAAYAYDKKWMDEQDPFWDFSVQSYHTGKSNSEILEAIYPHTNEDIFAYQFSVNADVAMTNVYLQSAVASKMPNTREFQKDQVFRSTPVYLVGEQNGVLCVRHVGYLAQYPYYYWSCAHPYNPQSYETSWLSSVSVFPGDFKTKLDAITIDIFIMEDAAAYNSFFGMSIPTTDVYGHSVAGDWTAVFLSVPTTAGPVINNRPYVSGIMMHELGHQLDWAWTAQYGQPSASGAFTTAMNADKDNMNLNNGVARPCTDVWSTATCSDPDYAGLTNWEILHAKTYDDTAPYTANPEELFAMAFQKKTGELIEATEVNNVIGTWCTSMGTYMTNLWNNGHP